MSESDPRDSFLPSRHDFSPLPVRDADRVNHQNIIPHSSSNTFGRLAVTSNAVRISMSFGRDSMGAELKDREFYDVLGIKEDEARSAADLSASHAWYERQVQLAEGEFQYDVANIKDTLAGLNRHEVAQFEKYMNQSAPNFLIRAKALTGYKGASWREWMSEATSNPKLHQELLNILEWHNYIVQEQQQDPQFKYEIERCRAAVKQAVGALIETGFIIANVEDIDQIDVKIHDVFDTLMQGRWGYYLLTTLRAVIAQGVGKTPDVRARDLRKTIEEALPHEFVHAFLDTSHDTPMNPLRASWIRESLTENLSTVIREYISWHDEDGNPVEPATYSPIESVSYFEELDLVDTLLIGRDESKSDKREMVTAALRGLTGGYEAAMKFSNLLDEAWGHADVLTKITNLIDAEERAILFHTGNYFSAREVRIQAVRSVNERLKTVPDSVLLDREEIPIEDVAAVLKDDRTTS